MPTIIIMIHCDYIIGERIETEGRRRRCRDRGIPEGEGAGENIS